MKLFARFLGKTPPSPATLQASALHADDESLQIAAIDKLADGDALRKSAGLSAPAEGTVIASPTTLERAARARMAQLIDAGSIDFDAFCAQARNQPAMFAVAALCK